MALKTLEIRAFSPTEKPYRKTDNHGLYLEVRPNGSKTWYFKYRVFEKEKRLSIGSWPRVGLSEARQLRDAARSAVREGKDPLHDRKHERTIAKLNAANSFQSVAEDFIKVRFVGGRKASATIEKARWFLSHLTGPLGRRPIAEIEPVEVMAALKSIEHVGKRETAIRTRAFASRVFRHGVAMGFCKDDPAALLGDGLMSPIVTHRAAILEPRQFGELLRAIDAYGGGEIVRLAMQILPHVFVRPGELRHAKWDEIDWDAAIWRVPAERTKLRRVHSVPLSKQSLDLFTELRRHTGWMNWMFPGERSHLKPMSENAINTALRRMGFDRETVTAHGFRASASTMLNESGKWHPDAIERALAHGHSNAVRGVYARGQHWDERVRMGQWWSDYLDELKQDGVVVPMQRHTPATC